MTGAIAIEPLSVVQNGSPLAGNWQLVRWGGSITQTTPIEGSQITATFEGDRLSGSSGCNAYNATFKASSTAVTIGPIAATRRLCQPALSAQEIEYFRALNTVNAYTITASGELQLTYPTKDGQGILRFAHQAVTQATE
jgi:heat shock protein HslJ